MADGPRGPSALFSAVPFARQRQESPVVPPTAQGRGLPTRPGMVAVVPCAVRPAGEKRDGGYEGLEGPSPPGRPGRDVFRAERPAGGFRRPARDEPGVYRLGPQG